MINTPIRETARVQRPLLASAEAGTAPVGRWPSPFHDQPDCATRVARGARETERIRAA